MIANADALRLPFADGTIDAALCSPPYWGGLRVYDGPQARAWPEISYSPMPGLPPVRVPADAVPLGHEPDPFAFVGHLLQIFREVRRVLVPGGCLAVNLGDCYSARNPGKGGEGSRSAERKELPIAGRGTNGLASKNLVLMPWRFALAMQADGWILRSRMPGGVEVLPGVDVGIEPDVVWRKPSCMPESVRDRPTVDFEDVLLFSQGPRYFFDQEAGREQLAEVRNWPTWEERKARGEPGRRGDPSESGYRNTGRGLSVSAAAAGRNMRSSWTISPEPTAEEHFAAWPVALAARLIRVLTSERGRCPECGAPWVRQVERKGWDPTCAHDAEPAPCVVLDPFAGIGRTWEAARETGRRFVGTDLGLGYCRLALSRNDLAAALRRREAERARTITGPLFDSEPR